MKFANLKYSVIIILLLSLPVATDVAFTEAF